jgi:hypothetical protein
MSKRLPELIAATDVVLRKLEAPLTEEDRNCHWLDETQVAWIEYIRGVRDFLHALHREGGRWTSDAATEVRAWHIAHGLDSDGLHFGERTDALIGLQRTLVGDFRH